MPSLTLDYHLGWVDPRNTKPKYSEDQHDTILKELMIRQRSISPISIVKGYVFSYFFRCKRARHRGKSHLRAEQLLIYEQLGNTELAVHSRKLRPFDIPQTVGMLDTRGYMILDLTKHDYWFDHGFQ